MDPTALMGDCMPTDDLPGLGEDVWSRVEGLTYNTPELTDLAGARANMVANLVAEVELDYKTVMNRMLLAEVDKMMTNTNTTGEQHVFSSEDDDDDESSS